MLYDNPKYYEVAFSFRDIPSEVEFMQRCLKRFSKIGVNSLLEIGCGHAPHAGELIRREFSYTGLDINKNMLNHARSKWQHLRPALH
ncbi:MAG: class I SAM-dependent methyltransferase [candidate division Zixibacteria bacterium]|nr:class I SAM-dependent methyltransferase [candidate division Zixibacteria bacterium]MDH3938734.1 class I SAM-dependent methyltransferase [candidate division Zixibacteria bacterium]MDH4035110.1 class I SAM-dependent methyltransferase [candidate division Zixibacteria bacterium]